MSDSVLSMEWFLLLLHYVHLFVISQKSYLELERETFVGVPLAKERFCGCWKSMKPSYYLRWRKSFFSFQTPRLRFSSREQEREESKISLPGSIKNKSMEVVLHCCKEHCIPNKLSRCSFYI